MSPLKFKLIMPIRAQITRSQIDKYDIAFNGHFYVQMLFLQAKITSFSILNNIIPNFAALSVLFPCVNVMQIMIPDLIYSAHLNKIGLMSDQQILICLTWPHEQYFYFRRTRAPSQFGLISHSLSHCRLGDGVGVGVGVGQQVGRQPARLFVNGLKKALGALGGAAAVLHNQHDGFEQIVFLLDQQRHLDPGAASLLTRRRKPRTAAARR